LVGIPNHHDFDFAIQRGLLKKLRGLTDLLDTDRSFALLPLHIHQITMRAPEKRMTAAATPTRAIRLPVMTQLRHRESPGK
jgi:hypothetical protein